MGDQAHRQVISTPDAPAAIGPYSQAIKAGNLLFTAGQIPLDPATMKLVDGDVTVQAERVMKNLEAVLTAAGSRFAHVVKTTCFLADLNDFPPSTRYTGSTLARTRPPVRPSRSPSSPSARSSRWNASRSSRKRTSFS